MRSTPTERKNMSLTVEPETAPLKRTVDGVIQIGETRVPLDSVVIAFRDGATAETIADRFPSLTLVDVYSTIAYFLRHPLEVNAYLTERARVGDRTRIENERRFSPENIRSRLVARLSSGDV